MNITDSIADTLFIMLYAKAVETNKRNPLITDLKACELVDKIDYDFSRYKNKKASSVGVVLRASHFDNMAKQFIEKHANLIVVLVGCGLDARKQRLGSTADKAVFYELDIDEADNKTVFTELAKRFNGAEIHFDMLNRWMSKKSSLHDTVSKTNATFRFCINDEKEIEKWHSHLKHQQTYLFNAFRGWQRLGFVLSTLMSIVPVFKTSTRLMTYKIEF